MKHQEKTELQRQLRRLARLSGVELSYRNALDGRRRNVPQESLLAVVGALGAPVSRLESVPAAVREMRQSQWQRMLPPVLVLWNGEHGSAVIRLPQSAADGDGRCQLTLDSGPRQTWTLRLAALRVTDRADVEGTPYVSKTMPIPGRLPLGYHRLTLEVGGRRAETCIISAPKRAYAGTASVARPWGLFLPLHAAHSARSWGSGDFSDLSSLMNWVADRGGGLVATLPFLAASLDQPCEPSPYSPWSRLFWNEFFVDPRLAEELGHCPTASRLMNSTRFQDELTALRASPMVRYREAMTFRREVLDKLSRCLWARGGDRLAAFRGFLERHPQLRDYAEFRATGERRGTVWREWPARQRGGALRESDYERPARRYHEYVQWLAHGQLEAFAKKARRHGPGLYLDLPLGVNADGYDVWRFGAGFASGVAGGAPPDVFFTRGQDWGFPPLHPERIREQGYAYFISCVRHQLRYAGILRVDHIMGLHRLFWVPSGMPPTGGAYVRYHAEEFYAILALESQRHHALLVGEDLGTVPGYVRPAMARHGVYRSYVLQYEIQPDPKRGLAAPPAESLAGLNTHDMPTFAGFWKGRDIEDRVALGLLDAAGARREGKRREKLKRALVVFLRKEGLLRGLQEQDDIQSVLRACLAWLGRGPAGVVVANLEDLLGEEAPQNVPGTTWERPNWRRKTASRMNAYRQAAPVRELLAVLDKARRQVAVTGTRRISSPRSG